MRSSSAVVAVVAVLALAGCSAGTSRVEACVEHAVEEGVDRGDALPACEDAVGGEE